jgi:hypothetical protein
MKDMIIRTRANVRALTGVDCDNAWVVVDKNKLTFYTDFRYIPMAHRVAPGLKVRDIKRFKADLRKLWGGRGAAARRIGFEKAISVAEFDGLRSILPRAKFADVTRELERRRAVKTPDEVAKMRAAVALNDAIWHDAQARFRPGMSEREMASVIRTMMFERGDGEAFDTIVCVGANAAECHHVPDGTVWDGKEPVLVDMVVKLDGYCSDMTRNIVPRRASRLYRKVYALVLEANRAAVAAEDVDFPRCVEPAAQDVAVVALRARGEPRRVLRGRVALGVRHRAAAVHRDLRPERRVRAAQRPQGRLKPLLRRQERKVVADRARDEVGEDVVVEAPPPAPDPVRRNELADVVRALGGLPLAYLRAVSRREPSVREAVRRNVGEVWTGVVRTNRRKLRTPRRNEDACGHRRVFHIRHLLPFPSPPIACRPPCGSGLSTGLWTSRARP